mmetsp:Transcript_9227/g.13467  ORF Transcript_9227/g.13467 Transcript_9227/m.13467 type:complete len:137 (+) Transcript_9227:851-1261(+)
MLFIVVPLIVMGNDKDKENLFGVMVIVMWVNFGTVYEKEKELFTLWMAQNMSVLGQIIKCMVQDVVVFPMGMYIMAIIKKGNDVVMDVVIMPTGTCMSVLGVKISWTALDATTTTMDNALKGPFPKGNEWDVENIN